jgi:hypothetical protein
VRFPARCAARRPVARALTANVRCGAGRRRAAVGPAGAHGAIAQHRRAPRNREPVSRKVRAPEGAPAAWVRGAGLELLRAAPASGCCRLRCDTTLHACTCSGPPPGKVAKDGKDGWSKGKLPDGRMVWVATPKNAVERIPSILVIERKSTTARYYCLKCNTTFFGSRKRIKEHLRGDSSEGKDAARNCTVPITPEEEAVCLEDDEQDPGRAPRQPGADGEGSKDGARKRKRPPLAEHRNPDCDSPFPGTEPAPAPEGWQKVKDPRFDDNRLIWVALPKNDIERMPAVYVVERRATTSRYLCTKCKFMYWGSKKRVKEHLRDQAGDVKGCTVRITPEEEELLQKDDAVTRVRTSRASLGMSMYACASLSYVAWRLRLHLCASYMARSPAWVYVCMYPCTYICMCLSHMWHAGPPCTYLISGDYTCTYASVSHILELRA